MPQRYKEKQGSVSRTLAPGPMRMRCVCWVLRVYAHALCMLDAQGLCARTVYAWLS